MSTLDPKPVKIKRLLNPKLLPIAALLLVVLALLFMATPLLRTGRAFQPGGGNFGVRGNGQNFPQNGFPTPAPGTLPQGRVFNGGQNGTNFPAQRLAVGGGFLNGVLGTVIYFVALMVSLAAAVGMFLTRRWGQVLGIIMAVIYFLLGLLSLLPLLLLGAFGLRNPLSLILGAVHVVLAVVVIVLASIPAKPVPAPLVAEVPPA
jgi:hypothetical protein